MIDLKARVAGSFVRGPDCDRRGQDTATAGQVSTSLQIAHDHVTMQVRGTETCRISHHHGSFDMKSPAARGMVIACVAACLIFALAILWAPVSAPSTLPQPDIKPELPIRAGFYYPWFPEHWTEHEIYPYTHYHPSLGFYNSADKNIIRQHIAAMRYGKIGVGI